MISAIGVVPHSLIFYVDDLLLFCNASIPNVKRFIFLLEEYVRVSGKRINASKSNILLRVDAVNRKAFIKICVV